MQASIVNQASVWKAFTDFSAKACSFMSQLNHRLPAYGQGLWSPKKGAL
jgi:hypothetical protein